MNLVPFTIMRYTALAMDDDLLQEGYMGLWKAAQTYRKETGASFTTYGFKCVLNSIRYSERKKRRNLVPSFYLSQNIGEDGDGITLSETIADQHSADGYVLAETLIYMEQEFTEDELAMAKLRLQGIGVWPAANKLGKSGTWGETRIRRIKEKLRRAMK